MSLITYKYFIYYFKICLEILILKTIFFCYVCVRCTCRTTLSVHHTLEPPAGNICTIESFLTRFILRTTHRMPTNIMNINSSLIEAILNYGEFDLTHVTLQVKQMLTWSRFNAIRGEGPEKGISLEILYLEGFSLFSAYEWKNWRLSHLYQPWCINTSISDGY